MNEVRESFRKVHQRIISITNDLKDNKTAQKLRVDLKELESLLQNSGTINYDSLSEKFSKVNGRFYNLDSDRKFHSKGNEVTIIKTRLKDLGKSIQAAKSGKKSPVTVAVGGTPVKVKNVVARKNPSVAVSVGGASVTVKNVVARKNPSVAVAVCGAPVKSKNVVAGKNASVAVAVCGAPVKVKNVVAAVKKVTIQSEDEWHNSDKCQNAIRSFHDKHAAVPRKDLPAAKKDFEKKMALLRQLLESKNLCKRLAYTGSVYEGVNISGDELEFDIMFVADGKLLQLANEIKAQKGYSYVKPKNNMHNFDRCLDESGCLDPNKYGQYFYGVIQDWLNKMNDSNIELRKHGVASQIDVHKAGQLWYHVDLVPCFEISTVTGYKLYVPKALSTDEAAGAWRHSFSIQERDVLTRMDGNNECRKHCVRVVKAICKLRSDGLFKSFTSYHIKTVMFHLNEKKAMSWPERNLGKCVMLFLKEIISYMDKGVLNHKFEPTINLLEKITSQQRIQMSGCIANWLKREAKFYEVIKP